MLPKFWPVIHELEALRTIKVSGLLLPKSPPSCICLFNGLHSQTSHVPSHHYIMDAAPVFLCPLFILCQGQLLLHNFLTQRRSLQNKDSLSQSVVPTWILIKLSHLWALWGTEFPLILAWSLNLEPHVREGDWHWSRVPIALKVQKGAIPSIRLQFWKTWVQIYLKWRRHSIFSN